MMIISAVPITSYGKCHCHNLNLFLLIPIFYFETRNLHQLSSRTKQVYFILTVKLLFILAAISIDSHLYIAPVVCVIVSDIVMSRTYHSPNFVFDWTGWKGQGCGSKSDCHV